MSAATKSAQSTWSVVKKELVSWSSSATIYIVACVFLVLWEFLFFRDVFIVGEASLRGLFTYLPWLFLVLVPALTMGSISHEKSEGTLEFMLTHPVRDRELLLGKFLAATGITAVLLLFSVVIGLTLRAFGDLDWGVIAGQYFGAVCLAAVLVALGICVSSMLSSQMSALLVTAGAGFFLTIAGLDLVTARLPLWLAAILEQLSVLTHYESMSRGVLDLRDVWYFVSMITVLLSVAFLMLLRRRYGDRRQNYGRYELAVGLLIGIVVLTNVIGARIPGRVDLTEGRLYTLSDATRDVLKDLDDVTTLTLYTSGELPAAQQPVLRDVKDMLRDYETIGTSDIVVKYKNTTGSKKTVEEATSRGVQEVQFNTVADEEFKVKKGFFGITVSHAGQHKAIPFVQNTGDLEYQLTSLISELTVETKPKLGFLSGHGEKDPAQAFPLLQKELARQFDVQTVTIDKGALPKDLSALVVAGPTEKIKAADKQAIEKFVDGGGSAMFLIDRVTVDLQSGSASANENSGAELVSDYGVTVSDGLVYDLQSNTTAGFGGGGGLTFQVPYAFWPRVKAQEGHPTTRGIQGAIVPWASPVEVDDGKLSTAGFEAEELLVTTEAAGVQQGTYNIQPQQKFDQDTLGERVMAVALTGKVKKGGKASRIVVVGDTDLFTDQFLQRSPENVGLALQSMSWLGQEASLASIKVKNSVTEKLEFDEKSTSTKVKWANLILALLVPAIFGGVRLWRRRKLATYTYTSRKIEKDPRLAQKKEAA